MRKILAGLAVAAAGVVGVSGVASAHFTGRDDPQPWGTMCVSQWNREHPDERVGPLETYMHSLYARMTRLATLYGPMDDGPKKERIEAMWTQAADAWAFQKRECLLKGH